MLEEGLVKLIQAGTNNLAPGGWGTQLPENKVSKDIPKAWTYRVIVSDPSYVLTGQNRYTTAEIQIDCCGFTAADAQALARAIENVLSGGYSGTLNDADSTLVHGIFRMGPYVDGFSDANRSYVRTLQYQVDYDQA